jgi:peptide/nickel transport system permease protein
MVNQTLSAEGNSPRPPSQYAQPPGRTENEDARGGLLAGGLRARPSVWNRFRRHRLAILGVLVFGFLIVVSALAPLLATHDPNKIDLSAVAQPPSREHFLGTDLIGRDVYSRLLYGGRVSLLVGVASVAVSMSIAIVLGTAAGFYRGPVEMAVMRITDVVMCFPILIILISLVALVGPGLWTMILALGVLGWPWDARIARAQTMSVREREFVQAAHSSGVADRRLIFRHILPNISAPLIVAATFGVAWNILLEATLSFLGLGVQEPTPSWGSMLNAARAVDVIERMPWLWLPAGLLIAACVLSVNFIGDGLRDALDPRSMNQ